MAGKQILTHPKVRKLQRTLYQQAKLKPKWKAWSLYGDCCRKELVEEAMSRTLSNKGRSGVDGYTVEEMSKDWTHFRDTLEQELKEKRYKPSPILRVAIPKGNGKLRYLGIPTVKDRVVQMVVNLVLQPIFDADFHDESYGYRPRRSAQDAVKSISKDLYFGKTVAIEADLSQYFDTIRHERLMKLVKKRVSDGAILELIKSFLCTPILEENKGKRKMRPPSKKGVPQGGVISPLLANLYLDKLDKEVNQLDPRRIKMIRYADDFVILVEPGLEKEVLKRVNRWLQAVGLTLNQEKTKITDTEKEGVVEFLGFELRERVSQRTKGRYIQAHPSKKAMQSYRDKIRKELNRQTIWLSHEDAIKRVNRITRGWGNYYLYGSYIPKFMDQNRFLTQRVRHWLRRKHKTRNGMKALYKHYPDARLKEDLGLYTLPTEPLWKLATANW